MAGFILIHTDGKILRGLKSENPRMVGIRSAVVKRLVVSQLVANS